MALQHYDVVIIGGGPAGCATVLGLLQQGVDKVLLLEPRPYSQVRVGESIPPDTRLLFTQLGIWREFQAQNYEICLGSRACWGTDEVGYNDFLFNPHGHGWHLDRCHFDTFMAQMAQQRGAQLRMGHSYQSQQGNILSIRDEQDRIYRVQADFVVDASGQRSVFARSQGARKVVHDRLICVYGFFDLPTDSFLQQTLLEAVDYGWWYAAKLPQQQLALAVATDALTVKQYALSDWQQWLTRAAHTQHIAPHLSGCQFKPHSLLVVPVVTFHLDRCVGEHWLAVGDAASAYDPLSAQGIYKALATAWCAAEAIAQHGSTTALATYQQFVFSQFQGYLRNRDYFYQQEQRWSQARFWMQRHECSAHF